MVVFGGGEAHSLFDCAAILMYKWREYDKNIRAGFARQK